MRRTLALCAAAALLHAAPAAASSMDLQLWRLGAPEARVWDTLAAARGVALAPGEAQALATAATQDYRQFAMQLGLALSAPVLEDAATGGRLAWEAGLELTGTEIRSGGSGTPNPLGGPPLGGWPTVGPTPQSLQAASLLVRKGLPWSLDVSARALLVTRSQMGAVQLAARWAFLESYGPTWVPDVALRVAATRLVGQRDLSLTALEAGLTASRRFRLGAAGAVSPFATVRLTGVSARTAAVDFDPTATCGLGCTPDGRSPAQVLATSAAFPDLAFGDHLAWRWSAGAKATWAPFAAAVEVGYQAGKELKASGSLPAVLLPEAWTGALRLGVQF